MSDSLNAFRSSYDRITLPNVWVAFVLSLVLHSILLWGGLPKISKLPFEDVKQGKQSGSLDVRLAPPPSRLPSRLSSPAQATRTQPTPAPGTSPPRAAQRQPSAPRVIALESPSPSTAIAPPAEAARPPADAAKPAANEDLASFIEARRRARGAVPAPPPSPGGPPSTETEQERHNRTVAANLGLNRTPSFGADTKPGGGIFQVMRMGYNDAEFVFFGWNKDISRNSRQTIEVRRGDNPSMEVAVVRKMIAIIREHVNGDFQWGSPRLRREVTLSSRVADNAGLEDFMMLEFFPDRRR